MEVSFFLGIQFYAKLSVSRSDNDNDAAYDFALTRNGISQSSLHFPDHNLQSSSRSRPEDQTIPRVDEALRLIFLQTVKNGIDLHTLKISVEELRNLTFGAGDAMSLVCILDLFLSNV